LATIRLADHLSIRACSSAPYSRGHCKGWAEATADAVLVLDAASRCGAGRDRGSGQNEVEVRSLAETVVLR
jgi:putative protein kinase ArgK-like GTPase of G3E family